MNEFDDAETKPKWDGALTQIIFDATRWRAASEQGDLAEACDILRDRVEQGAGAGKR